MSSRRLAFAFGAIALVVVAAANVAAHLWRIDGRAPPEYGTWSGVLQLERKMRLLQAFAAQGPVDALVLSSSMGDHGIAAEVLTREMSAHLGRPFRVFNFSMGGADLATYSRLYRLARVVSRPRELWIVSPVSGPPQAVREGTLDHKLIHGPVSAYGRVPLLLPASYAFHQVPIVRQAPALRDAALHGAFRNRPVTNLDLYDINASGDTLSFLYNVTQYEHGAKARIDRRDEVVTFETLRGEAAQRKYAMYFVPRTLEALEDLRAAAAADGVPMKIVAFDSAAGFEMRDPDYLRASTRFFEPLARLLGGVPVVDVRPDFELHPYMVSDTIHLNSVGAAAFSRLLAARMAGKPAPAPPGFAVDRRVRERLPDPQWTTFTALLPRAAGEAGPALRLRYVQNWGLRRLATTANVRLAVRRADGREGSLPARVVAPGEVVVDAARLGPAPSGEILVTQLVFGGGLGNGIGLPLASYEWLASVPNVDFQERRSQASLEVAGGRHSPLSPIDVRWSGIRDPSPRDWVGIFPADAESSERISIAYTGGSAEGARRISAVHRAGTFEARLFRHDSWELIAVSRPFRVEALSAALDVPAVAVAGEPLPVRWKALNFPDAKDWIGLFLADGTPGSHSTLQTGGGTEGALALPTTNVKPGSYEVRLYSAGGWVQVASVPLRIEAPTARR